jgi:hypothetical protein|nr:MAG TPA: hypothetical protein [Caudoviricetes sp.]
MDHDSILNLLFPEGSEEPKEDEKKESAEKAVAESGETWQERFDYLFENVATPIYQESLYAKKLKEAKTSKFLSKEDLKAFLANDFEMIVNAKEFSFSNHFVNRIASTLKTIPSVCISAGYF